MAVRDSNGRFVSGGPDIATSFEGTFGAIRLGLRLGSEEVFQGLLREFKKDGLRWEKEMSKQFTGRLSIGSRKSLAEKLSTRTGELSRSMGSSVTHQNTIDSLELRKFSTSKKAITHELGTKSAGGKVSLRPRKAKYLTIPLEDAMTPSGVPRRPSARDWPDTFFFETEDTGKAFIVTDGDVDGELKFLYLLFAGEPKIPARLGMNKTHLEGASKRERAVKRVIVGGMKKGARRAKGRG